MASEIGGPLPTPAPIPGYPSLAHFLTSDRDRCSAIHRRFGYLSAQNLLMYECELSELEKKLYALHEADSRPRAGINNTYRDFETFQLQARNQDSEVSKRWQLISEIRDVLEKYQERVFFDNFMLSRPAPSKMDYEALFNTFCNLGEQSSSKTLTGASSTLYDNRDDLVSLRDTGRQHDRLSTFLQAWFSLFFQEKQDPSHPDLGPNPVMYTSHAKIDAFVTTVAIALAAAFLCGSIWSLYYVQTPEKTLGLITMWTTLFAVMVVSITNARRAEIFGACAAYAAVLVVFVGNNLGNGNR